MPGAEHTAIRTSTTGVGETIACPTKLTSVVLEDNLGLTAPEVVEAGEAVEGEVAEDAEEAGEEEEGVGTETGGKLASTALKITVMTKKDKTFCPAKHVPCCLLCYIAQLRQPIPH